MIRGIFLLHLFCNMIEELIVDHSDTVVLLGGTLHGHSGAVPSLLQFVFVLLQHPLSYA